MTSGFCRDCTHWRFEENRQLQNPDEAVGFGLCERVEQMKANPVRALARPDDEFASWLTRGEYGCNLFEPKI